MNRREFLKLSGLGAAAAGVVACAPKSLTSDDSQQSEVTGNVHQNYEGVGLLGFGAMRWPMIKDADGKDIIDQAKVDEMIDYAMAHGVNYYDSAPVYLQGLSEEATGKSLARYPRESYMVATKCSNQRPPYTFEMGKGMYERSMKYYQTDYIDYYLLHSLGSGRDLENRFINNGLLDYFVQEREAGRIKKLGFSFHGSRNGFLELMAYHEKYHWDFVQIQMNYIDWTHTGAGTASASFLYEELDKREIPIVIMEPLRGGRLANMPAGLADQMKSREPSRSLASWAFRFVGSYPRILSVLSGMTYLDHVKDNVRTFVDFDPLSDEEKAFLESIADQMLKYPLIDCTDCKYCMPCPYGIDIPGIFMFYNENVNAATYVVSKEQKDYAKARRRYLLKYNKAIPTVRQADHCIACEECIPTCPQRIRIPVQLKRIDDYIESLKQETL